MGSNYKLYKRIMNEDPKVVNDIKQSDKLKEQFKEIMNSMFPNDILYNIYYEVFMKGE